MSKILRHTKLLSQRPPDNPVVKVFPCGAALTKQGHIHSVFGPDPSRRLYKVAHPFKECEIVQAPGGWLVAAHVDGGKFSFTHLDHETGTTTEAAHDIVTIKRLFRYEDRLFAVVGDQLAEFITMRSRTGALVAIGPRVNFAPDSAFFGNGVIVQRHKGQPVLFVQYGKDGRAFISAPQLRGLTVCAALAGRRFVAVVAYRLVSGQQVFNQFEFWPNVTYSTYKCIAFQVDSARLNMTAIPRGDSSIVAAIPTDVTLCLKTIADTRTLQDNSIKAEMQLAHVGQKAVYLYQGDVWQLETTK